MMMMMTGRGTVLLLLAVVTADMWSGAGAGGGGARLWVGRGARAGASGVTCTAGGEPPPVVTWLAADFTPLQAHTTLWRILSNGTLLVVPPGRDRRRRRAAAGAVEVRCRATNLHGALVSPPITLAPAEEGAVCAVQAEAVQAGGVAALRCVRLSVSPSPPPTPSGAEQRVRWWRGDTQLTYSTPTPDAAYVMAGQGGEWLLVDGVTTTHHERYSCQLEGTQRSPQHTLHVTESMSSEPPRLPLTQVQLSGVAGAEGGVCLPCAAPDHPPPHYTWYREEGGRLRSADEGVVWRGGAALCFPALSPAHAGGWLCRASTARGDATARLHLAVLHPLRVTLRPKLSVASGGSTVRLECETGDPGAAVSWLYQGAPAAPAPAGDVTALGPHALLVRASPDTRGFWQCEARRGTEIHQDTAELRLAEGGPTLRYTFIEQALRAGARVSLRCAAAGTPRPRLRWTRDRHSLQSTAGADNHRHVIGEERVGSDEVVSTLNISAAAPEDGGLYTCRADNSRGYVQHSARLNIYGPPLVRAVPLQRVLAGENVTLLCPFAGYPINSVSWQRGGTVVGSSGRVSARDATLSVHGAGPGDAGLYTCTVSAPGGASASGDFHLRVLNPPKISPFMFSQELTQGDTVRVMCSVISGDQPFSFTWLKDGASLPTDIQVEATSLDDFSLLNFGKLTEQHSGDYTCRVTNPATAVNYTAPLRVRVPATWSFEPADTAVPAGAALRVRCGAWGRPAPVVTWHRAHCTPHAQPCEWRPLHTNGTLWAHAAARDLAGLYRCSAANGIGPPLHKHINISVYEPAQIESTGAVSNVSCVRAASSVCWLECVARGDHPLTVTWARASHALDLHSSRIAVSESRTAAGALRSELRVRAPSAADAGLYTCTAHNPYGQAHHTLLLNFEEPPVAPTQLRVSGRDSRRVRLSWRADTPAHAHVRYTALTELLHTPAPAPTTTDHKELILHSPCGGGGGVVEEGCVCAWLGGLQAGARYSVRVRVSSRAGASPLSEPLLFTTLEDAPSGPPQDVRARGGDPGELHVSWTPPMRATWNGELVGYVVRWRAGEAGGRAAAHGGATSALTLRSLRPRTQYSLAVCAFTRAGVGPCSPRLLAYTSEEEPEPPASLRCVSSARELLVLWSPAPSPATPPAPPAHPPPDHRAHAYYELLYAPVFPKTLVWSSEEEAWAGGWRGAVSVVSAGAGQARLPALRPHTAYELWVRLPTTTGAAATYTHCTTSPAPPEPVSVIRARAVSVDAVRVWWRAPTTHPHTLTHYMLYARDLTRSDSEWAQRVEIGGTDADEDGYEPARVVSGLRPRTRYEFWVRAHSLAGAAPASPAVQAPDYALEAARVWTSPRAVVCSAGARVVLRCGADGLPPLTRHWMPAPLPRNHRLAHNGDLHILGVSTEWAGNYTCLVRNPLGSDSVTHTLRTRPAPEPPPAPTAPRLARATHSDLHLTWDPLTPADIFPPLLRFTIEWKRNEESKQEVSERNEQSIEAGVRDADASARGLVVRGLACGATYRLALRAHNARGASPASPRLLATTAGHEPVPAAASEFVWANSSALRLSVAAWEAPCRVSGWRLALRRLSAHQDHHWTDIPVLYPNDDVVQAADLEAGTWYEVRVAAHWSGGVVSALYRVPTLNHDGDVVGESWLVRGEQARHAAEAWSALLAALAALLALAILTVTVWRVSRRGKCGGRALQHTPRARDLPPPPPLHATDYLITLPSSKDDISDISVMSARLSVSSYGAGAAVAAGGRAGDSGSPSECSERPLPRHAPAPAPRAACAACRRTHTHAHTGTYRWTSPSSLCMRPPAPPHPSAASARLKNLTPS